MSDPAPATPSSAPAASKAQVFAKRLTSTLFLWGLVAAALILAQSWLFFLLLGGLGILSAVEFANMDRSVPRVWRGLLMVATVCYFAAIFTSAHHRAGEWPHELDSLFLAGVAILAFVPALFRPLQGRDTLWAIAFTIAGFVYVSFLWSFLVRLVLLPDAAGVGGIDASGVVRGTPYALFVIACTKLTDSGAYVVGSLIGKHKMIPHVSPGKTWEGMIGAALGALIGSMAVWWGFSGRMPLICCGWMAAALGLLLGAVCVVGDLAESIIKRCLGVKDSGKMLPGIGGALDLTDSLLYTAPVFYFCLYALGR